MFHCRATVHEGLSNDRQTRVDDVGLVDVKHKLWVLDNVHPESQRKTVYSKEIYVSTYTAGYAVLRTVQLLHASKTGNSSTNSNPIHFNQSTYSRMQQNKTPGGEINIKIELRYMSEFILMRFRDRLSHKHGSIPIPDDLFRK